MDTDSRPFRQRFLNRSSLDDQQILSGQFWAELRVFLAVAKAGSYNRAAAILNMSQPTVSRQVKRLQDLMDTQLVVSTKTKSGIRLTVKGRELARSLAVLDQSLYVLSTDLKAETRRTQGLVRVAVSDGLSIFFLVPAIRDFSTVNPFIQISVQSPRNFNDLRENQTDMMISFAPVEDPAITSRKVGTLHLIPIASSLYIEQYGVPDKHDLSNHLFVQSPIYSGAPLWAKWEETMSRGRIAHFADNSIVHGMMVKAGLGIGLLGNYTLLEPSSVFVDLDVHVPLRLYCSVITERLRSRPVEIAYDWVCAIFGEDTPWFGEENLLKPAPSIADVGFKIMFNLA